jgi:hypothetical protein
MRTTLNTTYPGVDPETLCKCELIVFSPGPFGAVIPVMHPSIHNKHVRRHTHVEAVKGAKKARNNMARSPSNDDVTLVIGS